VFITLPLPLRLQSQVLGYDWLKKKTVILIQTKKARPKTRKTYTNDLFDEPIRRFFEVPHLILSLLFMFHRFSFPCSGFDPRRKAQGGKARPRSRQKFNAQVVQAQRFSINLERLDHTVLIVEGCVHLVNENENNRRRGTGQRERARESERQRQVNAINKYCIYYKTNVGQENIIIVYWYKNVMGMSYTLQDEARQTWACPCMSLLVANSFQLVSATAQVSNRWPTHGQHAEHEIAILCPAENEFGNCSSAEPLQPRGSGTSTGFESRNSAQLECFGHTSALKHSAPTDKAQVYEHKERTTEQGIWLRNQPAQVLVLLVI
jgi:hypothetical protein